MSAQPASASTQTEIRSALIPIEGEQLLLPNTAVAEVIGYVSPEPIAYAPEWLLGQLYWRHRNIPLVALASAFGEPQETRGKRARVAVLNTLNGNTDLPFIAILISATPRLVRATDDQLRHRPAYDDDSELVLARVGVAGEEAIIPNLDKLESRVLEHLDI